MIEKRFTLGGTDAEPLVKDNITGKEYPTQENSLMELLNELNDENQRIKLENDGLRYALKYIKQIDVEIDIGDAE